MPCIEAIKARCQLHPMESERDYRLTGTVAAAAAGAEEESDQGGGGGGEGGTWKVTSDAAAGEEWLSKRLKRLTKGEKMVTVEVAMGGRRIHVGKAGGGAAHLHFDEVCASALGAGDYTAIASVGVESKAASCLKRRIDVNPLIFSPFVCLFYTGKIKESQRFSVSN